MWRVEEQPAEPLFVVAGGADPGHRGRSHTNAGVAAPGYNSPLAPMTMRGTRAGRLRNDEPDDRPASDEVAARAIAECWRASDLAQARHGSTVQIAGNVICRQRPGTAKGFVFISLEDETGVSNAIVTPDLFEKMAPPDYRRAVSADRRRSAKLRRRGADQSAANSPARARPIGRQRIARFSLRVRMGEMDRRRFPLFVCPSA